MKAQVQVGARMTREAWETVTWKLLDLVGGHLGAESRVHVQNFIRLSGRAWSDLEQRAAGDNPGAQAPAIRR